MWSARRQRRLRYRSPWSGPDERSCALAYGGRMRVGVSLVAAVAVTLAISGGSPVSPAAANDAVPASATHRVTPGRMPATPAMTTSIVGLHVPWAVGGPRIERDGTLRQHPGEWPNIPVRSLRLWDTRTAWLNIEPAQDQWEFAQLDAEIAIAHAHGVSDITLVLWGTPVWAASSLDADDAGWLGPGAAAPPRSMADWRDFVAKVSDRYRGVITAYEIGNEPDDPKFWRGTPQQFAEMVSIAARTIRAMDSVVTVVAPAALISMSSKQPAAVRPPAWSANVDALSFHWYPRTSVAPSQLRRVAMKLRAQARGVGLGGLPLWLTEVNYRGARVGARRQYDLVAETNVQARSLGLKRVYWYAWTDLGPPELLPIQPGTPAALALRKAND